MIIFLSPSKSIDFSKNEIRQNTTIPQFEKEANYLMSLLSGFRADEIAEKEKISIRIAFSTYEYIQTYPSQFAMQKEAVFAYSGNVYDKLNAAGMDDTSLHFLQKHVSILSAL
jgi:cytoplasmic iron level regulating protein YaaA (DUF328/UPF0246 family)